MGSGTGGFPLLTVADEEWTIGGISAKMARHDLIRTHGPAIRHPLSIWK